jgi:hypothetical protein
VLDLFNGYMWEQMFPWIKYDGDRFDAIRLEALKVMKNTLADYNKQWEEFRQHAAWYGGAQRKKHNIKFRPVLHIRFGDTALGQQADLVYR